MIQSKTALWLLLTASYLVACSNDNGPDANTSPSFNVGTFSLALEDQDRLEPQTPDPGDNRKLVIQFWYPTDVPTLPRQVVDYYGNEKTVHSVIDAPPTEQMNQFDVILFSHGFVGNRDNSEFLMEALATAGYVVIAIDHVFYGAPVTFPDGSVSGDLQRLSELFSVGAEGNPETIEDAFAVWVDDADFAIDSLTELNADSNFELFDRLRLDKIGYSGHSFGGGLAVQCLDNNPTVVAAINMDGGQWGQVEETGTDLPFMHMLTWGIENTDTTAPFYANSKAYYLFEMEGADHQVFADRALALWGRQFYDSQTVTEEAGQVLRRVIIDYTLAFFNYYLRDEPSILLAGQSPDYFNEVRLLAVAEL